MRNHGFCLIIGQIVENLLDCFLSASVVSLRRSDVLHVHAGELLVIQHFLMCQPSENLL